MRLLVLAALATLVLGCPSDGATSMDEDSSDAPAATDDAVSGPADASSPDVPPSSDAPDVAPEPDAPEPSDAAPAADVPTEVDAAPDGMDVPVEPPWCILYGEPVAVGTLQPDVVEASGLVVSALDPGRLWVHEDSGALPHIHALQVDGTPLGTLHLVGANPYDWEDLAGGPCEPGGATRGCLYPGDIGDNASARSHVIVHRVEEPAELDGTMDITEYETMTAVYPDGARDCEALVVDDAARTWLLTKEWGEGVTRLYRAPFQPGATGVVLEFVSEEDVSGVDLLGLVTAADLRPEPPRLALRLYGGALEYRLGPEGLDDLSTADRIIIPTAEEVQGEAIAYGPEGYFHVSEGQHALLFHVPCQ